MKTATAESVRALLEAIVDYAGLFPPAQLDMASTVKNYTRYLQSNENWMLGRLIVPIARLAEFEREATELLPCSDDPDSEPWQISVLTVPASDAMQFSADLAAIDAFNDRHEADAHGLAVIDTIELKAQTADEIGSALDVIPENLFPFFELPIDRDPRGVIAELADAEAGAKVRTGGTNASVYPQPEHLARFIAACAAASSTGVPFKATAGLHHPLRHHSKAVNAMEFGFLNVFMAGCLAHAHELDEAAIRRILEDNAIESFAFDEHHAAWRDISIDLEAIENARNSLAVSFGSCSFDEPIQDLRALGLMA